MILLQMGFMGTVLVVVTAVLRALTRGRLPRTAFLVLWWLALARFLLPFSLPSPVSAYGLLENTPPVQVPALQAAVSDMGNALPEVTPYLAGPVSAVPQDMQADFAQPAPTRDIPVLPLLWVFGTAACAVWFAVVYFRCGKEFHTSLPIKNDAVDAWLNAHPLRRTVSVRCSDRVSAPLTYGLLRPVILLPFGFDFADENALNYVLTHEWTHIRRFDGLTKLFAAAAVCLHWWNPAAWVLYVLYSRDLEFACDAAVVRQCGGRAGYARALLRMEEHKSGLSPLCGFNRNAMEERIYAIMKLKRMTALTAAASVAMVASVGAVFATDAQAVTPTAETVYQSAGNSVPGIDFPTVKVDLARDAERLQAFAPYGITCDSQGKLYYNGERVRWFWDGYEIYEDSKLLGWSMRFEYYDPEGTVDAHTVREPIDNGDGSIDPFGPLTGVTRYSQEEFDAHDPGAASRQAEATDMVTVSDGGDILPIDEVQLQDALAPAPGHGRYMDYDNMSGTYRTSSETSVSVEDTAFAGEGGVNEEYEYAGRPVMAVAAGDSGDTAGGRTFTEIFQDFKPFGITYREKDGIRELFYNGEPVAHFADAKPDGGTFTFSSNGRQFTTLTVHTVYDKNGKLVGVVPDGQSAVYTPYMAFGVTIDADGELRLGSTLIRCLDDSAPKADGRTEAIGYYNPDGEIDVRAVRSGGELTGLETATQREFDSRVIRDPNKPEKQADNNSPDTADPLAMFSEYAAFGLTTENGALYFQPDSGCERVRVRLFQDMKKGLFFSREVSNWDVNGVQDVYAVRNWLGKLTGLRPATWREEGKNTLLFADIDEDEQERLEWSVGAVKTNRKVYPVVLSATGDETVVCEGKRANTVSVRFGSTQGASHMRVQIYRKINGAYETKPVADGVIAVGEGSVSANLFGSAYKIAAYAVSAPGANESSGKATVQVTTA